MKIVIIAGGKGTRISEITSEIPKAMIPIDGRPIIQRQIEMAKEQGFSDFIIITGHLGNVIQDYLKDGSKFGVNINYFQENEPLGTAGALPFLTNELNEDFFVFYGDTVMDIDLIYMKECHKSTNADATILLHPNDHPYDSDIVEINPKGQILSFKNKPHDSDFVSKNLVNAALFIFSPKIINEIPKGHKSHIEKDILPKCLEKKINLQGYITQEYIKDMGTPDRYFAVTEDVLKGKVARLNRKNLRPAIFLDRDGVIIKEVGLLHSPKDLTLLPGAAEAIKLINKSDYLAIIVTNQPVIARNLCSLEELELIHAKLETELGKNGAYINAIYFCPHHPDKGYPEERKEYKIECECRKPKPGMLIKAAEDWNVDIKNSYMIGDSERDVEAGKAAGCKDSILIKTNEPDGLLSAIKKILD